MTISSNKPNPSFSLLTKPTGAVCNLACEYCFYLSKDQLYEGSSFRMTDEVLKSYLKQYLQSQTDPEISVAWQGGEPTLMGLDFFKRSVELVNTYKKPGQQVNYTLQTNGTLLDEEWCTFFKKNNFLIGLSLDGTRPMHDAYRLNKGGAGTYDKVIRAWELLKKYKVDTNILCTIHAANASHPLKLYRFFRDTLQAEYIQLIPIVERIQTSTDLEAINEIHRPLHEKRPLYVQQGSQVSPRSVQPDQFGDFMIAIFDEWVQHDVGRVFIQTFDTALASWYGLPASVCIFQEVCGTAIVLEHNGDLYSCDHFVEPDYRLGNILETSLTDLASSTQQLKFGQDKLDRLPDYCRSCDVLFACHGECPRNRFITTPDGKEEELNYLCSGYKRFFHHIDQPMRIMAGLLRAGRAPAEIMELNSTHK
jgi:uncharacterized protein